MQSGICLIVEKRLRRLGKKLHSIKPVQASDTNWEKLQRATWAADVKVSQNSIWSVRLGWADTDVTHRHRRTVSELHWRWGEGRKNSERSQACSHTSHSYSTRGPGTHSHLQRAPQTLVTVWTSAWGQLLSTGGGHSNKSTCEIYFSSVQ